MKRFSPFIFAMMMAAVTFLTGCGEEIKDDPVKVHPASYTKLIEAYEGGRVFSCVEAVSSSKNIVRFEDGYAVEVPLQDFKIYDCTSTSPSQVSMNAGWWQVGSMTLAVRVETALADKNAWPVYVYYDKVTLHMHLSNAKVLDFPSTADKTEDEEGSDDSGNSDDSGDSSDDGQPVEGEIPIVRILTDGGAGIYNKEDYVKGSITIEDPDCMYSDVKEFTSRMGIRGRGNSTWSFPKKPWKVKLDEKAELLGMPADKEWALLANYADRTLIRNIVAMKLSEICEFKWTPRMRSVEVYLNDEYQGVYTLCEHKKVSSDRVNIDLVSESDNDGDAVTGGYYLEIEEQQDETTCWWTSMGVPMMFSDPEEPTARQLEYVKSYFESFEQALQSKDWTESTGYLKYIDVDSFVDYYIVQELTKNIDGNLRKSSFITKERGQKMEMYHLWDFDLTLGNCGYFWGSVGNGPENFWIKLDKWYPHLFSDPAFVDRVQDRWNALMPEFEKIPDFIDEQVKTLGEAIDRNFQRWSIYESVDWVYFPSLGSYEKELDYLKAFYTERLEWLDRELNKL